MLHNDAFTDLDCLGVLFPVVAVCFPFEADGWTFFLALQQFVPKFVHPWYRGPAHTGACNVKFTKRVDHSSGRENEVEVIV